VNPTRGSTLVELQRTVADLQRSLANAQRELAERTAERDEALEHQTATSDVLKVISRSTFDLQPVLDTLLETGAQLCRAEQAVITLHHSQDGLYHYGTSFGYGDAFKELLIDNPVAPGRTSLIGRTALEGQVVHIEDAAADPDYKWAEALRLGRWHTGLGVPLLRDGSVIGILALTRRRVERFTDKQIELTKTFADQAVIAIENARLLVNLRESEERYGLVNQAVAEGIYEWDIERNSLWVSSRLIQIFGFEGRNLTAADWNELVHPEDFARYRSALRDCFKAVTPRLDCEYRVRHSDGNYRWVEDRGVPVRDMVGRAVRLVGAVSDISERKAADQALHEALDQQTATAEVLQVINASPGDLAPVFDVMLEKALSLCEAVFGVLWTYDGERVHVAASRGDFAFPEGLVREGLPTGPESRDAMGRLMRGEPIVHITDVVVDPDTNSANPLRRLLLDMGGRTLLAAPLRRDAAFLGYFAIYRRDVRPFTDKQIALLQNFAAQAVIAMENARLLGDLRERTDDLQQSLEYQTAISDVLKVISGSGFELAPVFQTVVSTAVRLCRADQATIYRLEDGEYRWAADHSLAPDYERIERNVRIRPGTGTLVGRVASNCDTVQILDAWTDPLYEVKDDARVGGVHTMLGVPLLRDGLPIGVIGLARRRIEAYDEREIALVRTFADQAVIAIENTRLITETQEALDQQTATAEVLQVINSSPGDLAPVFDAMLEKAMRLCEASGGALRSYDGKAFHAAAMRGVPAAFAEATRVVQPDPWTALGRIEHGAQVIQIPDLTDPKLSQTNSERRREMLDSGGIRTALWVALRKDETLLGSFVLYRKEVRPFTEKQVALVENLAVQAVIAMENARLITETREALEQQTATAEVLGVINSSPGNLAPVFEVMVERAAHLCEADEAAVRTFDGELLHLVTTHGTDFLALERLRGLGPTSLSGLYEPFERGDEVVHYFDARDTDAYRNHQTGRQRIDARGIRSWLAVALRKEGTLLGIINVHRREVRPFTDKQIALLQNFAAQAVIAMENARLLEEIRQRQAELRVTFDNMADGVVMFDTERRLAAWNRNFEELLDLPDAVLAERPTYVDYLRTLAERGEFGTGDVEAELGRRLEHTDEELRLERTRPDGRVIEVRRNAVPDGGFVLIYSDITERKRSEAEVRASRDAAETALRDLKAAQVNLIQAEKMASLGQLTAGIAHEIKNPLNFVNNFASLSVELLDELKEVTEPAVAALGTDKRAEVDETIQMLSGNLEKIAEHGQRADNIVKSMLEHSRGVSGERREVDLNGLVEEALNLAYHGARAQNQDFNITLERDYAQRLKPIELAPQEITRVFLNLFGNGFYAADKRAKGTGDGSFQPALTVATLDVGDAVEVRVRDNGTGIPPEIKDKLFQPFFTTKPTGEGTGLGLSISYDIVTQQHGGTITVESEPGAYTEFTIRLPRH
jgi:PAS domain S-box-containing protein